MRRTGIAVLPSAVLLALVPPALGACSSSAPAAAPGPLVIGADLELSGVDASIGTTYSRAIQLRVDQINAQGGVDGRQLVVQQKDNRSDPSVAAADISAFAAEPGIAGVIVGACSLCVSNVSKTIDDKQLPTITLAPATSVVRPVADHRYVFKLGPNAEDSATVLAGVLRNAGTRSAAVLTTDDIDGSDAMAAITTQASHADLNLLSRQTFKATDTDLDQPVHAALAKDPQALVVSAFPTQATLVAKAAREAGFTGQLFFDATAAGELFLASQVSSATEGAVMVAPQALVIDDVVATTPAKTARKRWFDDYTSKFGTFSGYSAYAADAIDVLVNAVRSVGGPLHQRMHDAMESMVSEGLSGQLRFTPDNHSGLRSQGLTTVVARSGRWRLFG